MQAYIKGDEENLMVSEGVDVGQMISDHRNHVLQMKMYEDQ